MNPVRFLIFGAFLCSCLALECYSGMSTETCKNSNDYCYNATIDKINTKMAGCKSSLECTLSQNDCITKEFEGYAGVKFCCCNTGDLCNSKFTINFLFPLILTASIWCL